jgi:hypothetical protein
MQRQRNGWRKRLENCGHLSEGIIIDQDCAIQGSLAPNPMKPHRIGLMPIEHKAVLDTCRALEKRGWAELED